MRKLVVAWLFTLALLGCQDGHIDEDKGAGSKGTGYTPQVITEANSAIFNLVGNDRQTYKTESLARLTTYANDRILSALGAKSINDLIMIAERASINGTETKTLSNGDVVDLEIYAVDSSSGRLSLTIEGKTDILTINPPNLIESEFGNKTAYFPRGKIEVFSVVNIDPVQSISSFFVKTDSDLYSVDIEQGKITYLHYDDRAIYSSRIEFYSNASQVTYAIGGEYLDLSYNQSTDTLTL